MVQISPERTVLFNYWTTSPIREAIVGLNYLGSVLDKSVLPACCTSSVRLNWATLVAGKSDPLPVKTGKLLSRQSWTFTTAHNSFAQPATLLCTMLSTCQTRMGLMFDFVPTRSILVLTCCMMVGKVLCIDPHQKKYMFRRMHNVYLAFALMYSCVLGPRVSSHQITVNSWCNCCSMGAVLT